MRIAIFLLAVLCITTFSSSGCAASDRCPRHNIKTNLKAKLAKTRVFQASSNDFSDYILGHHRGDGKILGFVNQSEIYTKFKYGFDLKKIGENRYCVNLERVDGYFYAAPKLYLPTDYKKSSCEYKEIHKHEKRHLQAVYDFHKQNKGKYATHMGRIARKVPIFKPVSTTSEANYTKQMIIDFFEQEFRIFEEKSIMRLNAIQSKIDSPSEYIGVQKRCSNW